MLIPMLRRHPLTGQGGPFTLQPSNFLLVPFGPFFFFSSTLFHLLSEIFARLCEAQILDSDFPYSKSLGNEATSWYKDTSGDKDTPS